MAIHVRYTDNFNHLMVMFPWCDLTPRLRVTFFLFIADILSEELSALRKHLFLLIYSPRSVKKIPRSAAVVFATGRPEAMLFAAGFRHIFTSWDLTRRIITSRMAAK
jgi:hypothetical protein